MQIVVINRIARWTALISFLMGTIVLTAFYFSNAADLIFFGYWYVLGVGLVNVVVLVLLLMKLKDEHTLRTTRNSIAIMCLNIPAVFVYFYFVILLLNTVRLELVNLTDRRITNIQLSGCESEFVDELKANESRTIWVEIPADCSIYLSYNVDGEIKDEVVYSYTTPFNGQKVKYRIGKDVTPVDSRF